MEPTETDGHFRRKPTEPFSFSVHNTACSYCFLKVIIESASTVWRSSHRGTARRPRDTIQSCHMMPTYAHRTLRNVDHFGWFRRETVSETDRKVLGLVSVLFGEKTNKKPKPIDIVPSGCSKIVCVRLHSESSEPTIFPPQTMPNTPTQQPSRWPTLITLPPLAKFQLVGAACVKLCCLPPLSLVRHTLLCCLVYV